MKIIQKLCAIFYCFPIISRIFSRVIFSICLHIWNIILKNEKKISVTLHTIIISFLARKKSQAVCLYKNIQLFVDFFVTLMEQRSHSRKSSLNGALPSRNCSYDLIPLTHSQQYSVPEYKVEYSKRSLDFDVL